MRTKVNLIVLFVTLIVYTTVLENCQVCIRYLECPGNEECYMVKVRSCEEMCADSLQDVNVNLKK